MAILARMEAGGIVLAALVGVAAHAEDVLFENVRIFDGKGTSSLSVSSNVLIRGNLIERISTDPIEAEGVRRIEGNGRTLMPGLIDAHWHAMLIAPRAAACRRPTALST